MMPLFPKVPQKYRIMVDCAGFSPKSIKTEVKNHRLVVSGREESKQEGGDYSIREFKKSYDLPKTSETDKLVSFMATGGNLVIEVPLKETQHSPNVDLLPRIVDNPDGNGKSVQMKFTLPENVDPSKASVSVKDRDLIFRVEDKVDKPDRSSRYYYYKVEFSDFFSKVNSLSDHISYFFFKQRTTLPENTEFDKLKCVQEKNQISISAPLDMDFTRSYRSIPIEQKTQQPQVTIK